MKNVFVIALLGLFLVGCQGTPIKNTAKMQMVKQHAMSMPGVPVISRPFGPYTQ